MPELDRKAASVFAGKVVRKDLVRKVKVGANVPVFVLKSSGLVLVMMWMRWSLPRLRIDQVMMTCLKYFLPISCVLLPGVCVWQLTVPGRVGEAVQVGIAVVSLAVVLVTGASLFRGKGFTPPGELPGAWGGAKTPVMRR